MCKEKSVIVAAVLFILDHRYTIFTLYTSISEVILSAFIYRLKISLQSSEEIQLAILNHPHALHAAILGGDWDLYYCVVFLFVTLFLRKKFFGA